MWSSGKPSWAAMALLAAAAAAGTALLLAEPSEATVYWSYDDGAGLTSVSGGVSLAADRQFGFTNPTAFPGTVEVWRETGPIDSFVVAPGSTYLYTAPTYSGPTTPVAPIGDIQPIGVRFVTSDGIVAADLKPAADIRNNDVTPLTNETTLGVRYEYLQYDQSTSFGTSTNWPFVIVVGTQEATLVTIQPAPAMGIAPYTMVLDAYDVYQLPPSSRPTWAAGDWTGTVIWGDKPIAVFSDTTGSAGSSAGDRMYHQLLPTHGMGRTHVVCTSAPTHDGNDMVRVITSWPGTTTVTADPPVPGIGPTFTLSGEGDWTQFTVDDHHVLVSDHPVMVGLFYYDSFAGGGPVGDGDPAYAIVPPVEAHQVQYPFFTPVGWTDYLNAFGPVGTTVSQDGMPLPPLTPVGASGYGCTEASSVDGTHLLTSSQPVGATIRGHATSSAYWMALAPGSPPCRALDPAPTPPENVAATLLSGTTVKVTWDPPLDTSFCPIEEYRVYRRADGSPFPPTPTAVVSGSTTQHIDILPAPCALYHYVVTAVTVRGESAFSGEASVLHEPADCVPFNVAPVLPARPCKELYRNQPLAWDLAASDADAPPDPPGFYTLAYTSGDLPPGGWLDGSVVRWPGAASGSFAFTLRVEDAGDPPEHPALSDERAYCILVLPEAPAPESADTDGDGAPDLQDDCPYGCDEEAESGGAEPPKRSVGDGCLEPDLPRDVFAAVETGPRIRVAWNAQPDCPIDHYLLWNGTEEVVAVVPYAGPGAYEAVDQEPWAKLHRYFVQTVPPGASDAFDLSRAVPTDWIGLPCVACAAGDDPRDGPDDRFRPGGDGDPEAGAAAGRGGLAGWAGLGLLLFLLAFVAVLLAGRRRRQG